MNDVFDALVAAADDAAEIDPGELVDASVAEACIELASARERVDAALLSVVGALEAREVHKADGALSAVPWLANRSSMSSSEARATVRAGRLVRRFERVAKLLAAGDVSADHVRCLSRFAIPARLRLVERDIDLLCDLAMQFSVDDYAKLLLAWASMADDVLGRGEPKHRYDRRGVTTRYHDGWAELFARGPAADIAEMEKHLDQHAPPDPADTPGGPRTRSQRRYDALCDLVGRGAASTGARPRPDRAFTIIADETTFAGGFNPDGRCETASGIPVPYRTAQRFACDSVIRGLVFDDDGEVLYYGRAKRLFTPAQRAAVMARDRTCIMTDCDVPATDCDIHHLDHFAHGGPTDIDNAGPACARHHTFFHELGWTARRRPDGTWCINAP